MKRNRKELFARGTTDVQNDTVETLANLLKALTELEESVRTMPKKANPNLLPLFARIEELSKCLPKDTDPILIHYLNKKSHEKARLYLQGRDAENQTGNCRHV